MCAEHFCFGFCAKTNSECNACTLYQNCRKHQVYELYELLAHAFTYIDALNQNTPQLSLQYKKICLTGALNSLIADPTLNPLKLPLQDFFTAHRATIVSNLDDDTDFVISSNEFVLSGIKNTKVEQAKIKRIPVYTEEQFKDIIRSFKETKNGA
jgi:hypothetical protein